MDKKRGHRDKILIERFNEEDLDELLKVVHYSLNSYILGGSKVVEGLKSLYSPESVMEKFEDPLTEIWVAKHKFKGMRGVMSLSEYFQDPNRNLGNVESEGSFEKGGSIDFDQGGLEIKMFYGINGDSFNKLLSKAKQRTLEKGLTYLSGRVIESGWKGFESRGGRDGKLYISDPFKVYEINQNNFEEFSLEVRYFNFVHNSIKEIEKYSCLMC
ncbi:hypothetical protein HOE04_04830 [archaeon]|jgi:hypothetical protein|nr:hypothetical protein [archaeon]